MHRTQNEGKLIEVQDNIELTRKQVVEAGEGIEVEKAVRPDRIPLETVKHLQTKYPEIFKQTAIKHLLERHFSKEWR